MKHTNVLLGAATAMALVFSSGAALAAPAVTDGQILGVVAAANDGEIEASKVAVQKGQKQEVKDYAATMVAQHESSNLKLKTVEVKSGISREETQASQDIKKRTGEMTDNLKNAKDADFDRTYIDGQVMLHEHYLTSLDNTLIPGAQNADVKNLLQEIRTEEQAHLDNAKKIQATFP